ncbi:MAG: xylulokinase [Promethearchaeota archaeon]
MIFLTEKLVAALDVGTTGCRTILFDLTGKEVARSYSEWKSIFPSPVMVEQDANGWWASMKSTIDGAIKKAGTPPGAIVGIAVTNQRETIVPVDRDCNPLTNAIVWQDRRTGAECEFIRERVGLDEVYRTTGLTIDPYFSGSKILWFKDNAGEVYEKAHKFLLVHDFIVAKLCGEFVTDHSNASRTMLFDIVNRRWSDGLASELGIDLEKMPRAVESGTIVGEVTTDETAFAKGTPVVAGAGDQQCAALGVGVVEPGRMKCTTGTGSFVLSYLDEPKFDESKRVLCSCHAVPGAWVNEASIFTTGSVLRWARDTIGTSECERAREKNEDPYEEMTSLAAQSPPGSNGLLLIPHFVGAGCPHWNPLARGVMFGLALGHTRGDIYRAIMEGVSLEVKKSLAIFNAMGTPTTEMRVTGGGSRASLWNQIMANVLNIPCMRGDLEESTAVGAAILATYGAGEFGDIKKAANEIAHMSNVWRPEEALVPVYEELFALTNDIYDGLDRAGAYSRMDAIVKKSAKGDR